MWSPERSPYSPGWAHSIVAGNPVQRSPEPVTVYIFTGIDVEVGSSRVPSDSEGRTESHRELFPGIEL